MPGSRVPPAVRCRFTGLCAHRIERERRDAVRGAGGEGWSRWKCAGVAAGHVGQGIGTALLGALLTAARDAGFRQMVAVIGGGEPASIALHARLGFRPAGRMEAVGRKFGRWLDTVYMQAALGAGSTAPPPVEPG